MLSEGAWMVETEEAVYSLDLTHGSITRLPVALTGAQGAGRVVSAAEFTSLPIAAPVAVEVGLALPPVLGFEDVSLVCRITRVPF